MRRKFALVGMFLLIGTALLAADTFTIDPVHSSVAFSVKHMVVSTVHGKFRDFSGTIYYDPKDVTKSSVEVHIKADSINTDSENRDKHLRSADFLDVEKFPELTFKSTQIEKTSDGYIAKGPLTIHGVSKDVAIPFTIGGTIKDAKGNTKLGTDASLTISRKDFGLTWNRAVEGGGVLVSDEVKIELSVEGTHP